MIMLKSFLLARGTTLAHLNMFLVVNFFQNMCCFCCEMKFLWRRRSCFRRVLARQTDPNGYQELVDAFSVEIQSCFLHFSMPWSWLLPHEHIFQRFISFPHFQTYPYIYIYRCIIYVEWSFPLIWNTTRTLTTQFTLPSSWQLAYCHVANVGSVRNRLRSWKFGSFKPTASQSG